MTFTEEDLHGDRIPDGVYLVGAISVTQRHNDKGNEVVAVTLAPIDEEHSWLHVVDYFVVAGPNPKAWRIGRRRLLRLLHATGVEAVTDVEIDLAEALTARSVHAELRYDPQTQAMRVRNYRQVASRS